MVNRLLAVILGATACMSAIADGDGDATTVFNDYCAACHQPEGVGTPGLAPPLAGTAVWQKLGKEDAQRYFFGVLQAGLSGTLNIDGMGYYGLVMPPQKHLSGQQALMLADYVLNDLNGLDITPSASIYETVKSDSSITHNSLMALRKHVGKH
tara:strand:- start:395 stop:853 length:459 start_codon:yes stop_codon:yes gene_type:complete